MSIKDRPMSAKAEPRPAGEPARRKVDSGGVGRPGGALMASPEYVVCLECETPCYQFEWEDGKISEVLCLSCGNDDPEQFLPPEELEEY
jgi:hypothetical protein